MVSPLDRKLLRDLWRMKGQAIAIGLVIGLGVMLLVMMHGLVGTLEETRTAYYERYRLADVFAPVARAPERLIADLAQMPGVVAVEGRVTGSALIDFADAELPIRALAISLPDVGTPRLNDVFLTAGRMPASDHTDEILLLQGFADARGLRPDDRLTATMNGARRVFRIVGLAQSPEFLYTTAPGEMVPDDARFAVFWMRSTALSAGYDMAGAFNEALLGLGRHADLAQVKDDVDSLLDAYGGVGAYGLEDQMSNRFISEELRGLRASSSSVPPIFLAVAAFLLYIVISRMVQAEREQIGLLKAFGYSSAEVSLHYLKFVLVIAFGGAILGSLAGVFAGRSMAVLYQAFYKFPFLVFQVEPRTFFTGFLVSVLAASAGSLFVLRGVFSLTPAVAMHPPAPADYSQSWDISPSLGRWLDQPSRMVLRRILRYPGRMVGAVVGIATGMALSVATISMMTAFDQMLDTTFSVIDRSDMTVVFFAPMSDKTLYELGRVEGVGYAEPFRSVPAILRNGRYSYRGAVDGLVAQPVLHRVIDSQQQPVAIRDEGVILGQALADILHISPGQTITIEVREGRRPVLEIPVVAVAETLLGAPAFMEITALNRALKEPNRASGAYIQLDKSSPQSVYKAIRDMPAVAGVSLKSDARAAFKKIMDTGAGAVRYVMAVIAAVITFGIVFNSARIAFAERLRDLASLQVIGFTRNETAFVLLGELALITLAAIPLGALLGHFLSYLISSAFSTDLYQIPVVFSPESHGAAALAVLLAALASGFLVKRDINRIDLVLALKTRE